MKLPIHFFSRPLRRSHKRFSPVEFALANMCVVLNCRAAWKAITFSAKLFRRFIRQSIDYIFFEEVLPYLHVAVNFRSATYLCVFSSYRKIGEFIFCYANEVELIFIYLAC